MNLQTTIDFDLKRFFLWWGGELAFLIPKRIKLLFSDRSGYLLFSETEAGFAIDFYQEDQTQAILRRHISALETDSFQQLKTQHPELERACSVLRLKPHQAIQKTLFLPVAAQENLQQVIRFELDRYTPFNADQVYFKAIPIGKTEQDQLEVLLVVTPKNFLDQQLAQLQAWGVQLSRVDYQDAEETLPFNQSLYNLLPERYQPKQSLLANSIHWLLAGLLLAAIAATLSWPVWQEGQYVERLKDQIKLLEKETQIIEEQQHEIEAVRDKTARLLAIKNESPALIDVLNELSNLLKEDTWLTHFQFSEKHLQIQGQSPAASTLIGILEASDFFSNVSFVSPLTQDKTTGRERFQISMDVEMPEQANEAPEVETSPDEAEPEDSTAPSSTDTAGEANDE